MEELVQQLMKQVGLDAKQAQQVLGVVSTFLKDKLPADVLNQVSGLVGGLGDVAGQAADAAGDAAGAAADAAGDAAGAAADAAGDAAGAAADAAGDAADKAQDAAGGIMSKISGMLGGNDK